jgi:hypothetical protein
MQGEKDEEQTIEQFAVRKQSDSHYFAQLPEQFDALLHLDKTRAVKPLERTQGWESGDLPETYPSGKRAQSLMRDS